MPFFLFHQEAERTALPSSLKSLTRGNQGLSKATTGASAEEEQQAHLEAMLYCI
jgi:hypothetical protein